MTTTQHTAGPWQDNDAGLIYGQVTGDDDEAPFICDCCDEAGSGEYTEREKANARLICAGPELLRVLKELRCWIMEGNPSNRELAAELIQAADTVIAKVKGGAA